MSVLPRFALTLALSPKERENHLEPCEESGWLDRFESNERGESRAGTPDAAPRTLSVGRGPGGGSAASNAEAAAST